MVVIILTFPVIYGNIYLVIPVFLLKSVPQLIVKMPERPQIPNLFLKNVKID